MHDPMKILLAAPRGFCAGVAMAIDVVDILLDVLGDEPLYVYHEIVHNRHVVDRFRQRGVTFVERLADVPAGATVVFSAHGVSPAVRSEAAARGLTAIDATCPLVTKVHAEAIRYARNGFEILLVGHADHQEVIGTRGEAPQAIRVIESVEDARAVRVASPDRVVCLTQTTLSMDDAAAIIGVLQSRFPQMRQPPGEDICYATTNRQHAVRRLAPLAERVLVVGSATSSNSRRLVEIAETTGTPARLIDDAGALDVDWLDGAAAVLVTAGASAPEDLVHDVVRTLVRRFGAVVEQVIVDHESVDFNLPVSLRREMERRGRNPGTGRIRIDAPGALQRFADAEGLPVRTVPLTVDGSSPPAVTGGAR